MNSSLPGRVGHIRPVILIESGRRFQARSHGLARRYENRAGKLLQIAAEQEKNLKYYDDKSYLYGRHGQDAKADAIALVQKHKLAAEKAIESAFHHRMVSQLAKHDYIASSASY